MTTRKSRREDREAHASEPTPPPEASTALGVARKLLQGATELSWAFAAGTDEYRSCLAAAHHLEALVKKLEPKP